MTIKRVLAVLIASSLFACMGEGVGRRGGLKREVVEKFPPEVASSYELFEHKCSRCHTLGRPLNAPIYELEHWEAYVARMRRQQGSGISESDAKTILIFLKYYADQRKLEKAEQSGEVATSTASGSGGTQ